MSFVKNSKDLSSSSATKEIFKIPNQTFSNIQNQWVLTTQQRNATEFTEHSKCSALKPHFILNHQQVPHSGDSACVHMSLSAILTVMQTATGMIPNIPSLSSHALQWSSTMMRGETRRLYRAEANHS